eukprot:SAG31_NODE_39523_length_286_cov_1.186170_1_plen_40_part_01
MRSSRPLIQKWLLRCPSNLVAMDGLLHERGGVLQASALSS